MLKPVTWTELGFVKRHVESLERRLKVLKRQNTKIIAKTSNIVNNQNHYMRNRGTRTTYKRKYLKKIQEMNNIYKSLLKFLSMASIPKPRKSKGRNFLVRLTAYEHQKLLKLLS